MTIKEMKDKLKLIPNGFPVTKEDLEEIWKSKND